MLVYELGPYASCQLTFAVFVLQIFVHPFNTAHCSWQVKSDPRASKEVSPGNTTVDDHFLKGVAVVGHVLLRQPSQDEQLAVVK